MPPDATEPPPDGSAAYHAQRLLDLLEERMTEQAASAEEHYILDQHRMEPYDSTRNAVQVMRQWEAWQACGVIGAAPTAVVYNQKEEVRA